MQLPTYDHAHLLHSTAKHASTQSSRPKYASAGEIHRLSECPYLIEHLRTPRWAPNDEIQKNIDTKLAENKWLRDKIELAKEICTKACRIQKERGIKRVLHQRAGCVLIATLH